MTSHVSPSHLVLGQNEVDVSVSEARLLSSHSMGWASFLVDAVTKTPGGKSGKRKRVHQLKPDAASVMRNLVSRGLARITKRPPLGGLSVAGEAVEDQPLTRLIEPVVQASKTGWVAVLPSSKVTFMMVAQPAVLSRATRSRWPLGMVLLC